MAIKKAAIKKTPAPVKKVKKPTDNLPRDANGRLIPRLKVVCTGKEYQFAGLGPDGPVCLYSELYNRKQLDKTMLQYRGLGFLIDDTALKGAR